MIGEANEPSFATTWWFFVSRSFQLTESPWLIVIDFGTNPVLLMLTWTVAAFAGAARPSAATAVTSSLRMFLTPLAATCPLGRRRTPGIRKASVKRSAERAGRAKALDAVAVVPADLAQHLVRVLAAAGGAPQRVR